MQFKKPYNLVRESRGYPIYRSGHHKFQHGGYRAGTYNISFNLKSIFGQAYPEKLLREKKYEEKD